MYKCNVKDAKGLRCRQSPAEPQFTKPLSYATDKHPQPQWLCERHAKMFPTYGAISEKLLKRATARREV